MCNHEASYRISEGSGIEEAGGGRQGGGAGEEALEGDSGAADPSPTGAAPTGEPEESASTGEPAREDTPIAVEDGLRDGDPSAQREEAAEEPAAPVKQENAPIEPGVGGDTPRARTKAGPSGGGREGAAAPSSPPHSRSPMAGPRRPSGLLAMENGKLAERLLERVCLPAFHE